MDASKTVDIYSGKDPLEMPLYTIAEASRYLKIPRSTVSYWAKGGTYTSRGQQKRFEPLITMPSKFKLSFHNLIELYAANALRTGSDGDKSNAVRVESIRPALEYAEDKLGIHRLLLSKELLTGGGHLFIKHYGELINLTQRGQVAIRELLERYLNRIGRDESNIPVRLYPPIPNAVNEKPVVIDPAISFGRPVITSKGIRTSMIAHLVRAGESINDIAYEYDIHRDLVSDAFLFEFKNAA
jgi:uncharacterized protein (DUF433 family)